MVLTKCVCKKCRRFIFLKYNNNIKETIFYGDFPDEHASQRHMQFCNITSRSEVLDYL